MRCDGRTSIPVGNDNGASELKNALQILFIILLTLGLGSHCRADSSAPRIGVYYFGMFSPRAFESGQSEARAKIARLYGAADKERFWWAGVRDLEQGNAAPELLKEFPAAAAYFKDNWTGFEPVIGWYDQSDPRTLERHINQATSNGISYFNFYWYWDFLLQAEGLNDGLDSFLKARNSNQIDFMLSVCEHGWHFTLPQRDFGNVAHLLVSKYISRSNYLKTQDGRLLLEICDPLGIRSDADPKAPRAYPEQDVPALRTFIKEVRNEAKRVLNRDLLVLTTVPNEDIMREADIDGGTCVTSAIEDPAPVQQRGPLAKWLTNAAKSGAYLPCVTEHFDERPRAGILKSPAQIMFDGVPMTPAGFRAELQDAKDWMDKRPDDKLSRFLVLYAWNEWHEGGILEPSVHQGAALISQIPKVFPMSLPPRKCRLTGRCPDAAGKQ